MRPSFFHHASAAIRLVSIYYNKINRLRGFSGFRQAMIGFQSANDHLSIMVSSMQPGNLSPDAVTDA